MDTYERHLQNLWEKIRTFSDFENSTGFINQPIEYMDKDSGLLELYVIEVWMSEEPIESSDIRYTVQLFEYLEEGNKEKFIDLVGEKQWTVVKNIRDTVIYFFGAERSRDNLTLSLELIADLHRMLMAGLLENKDIGVYRTIHVRPRNSSTSYSSPGKIQDRLSFLVLFTNQVLGECTTTFEAVKLSTMFFSEFLLIHPFKDGNGRTARLLFSHILRRWTHVPVSLFNDDTRRSGYINSLEERGRVPDSVPHLFLEFVVKSVERCISTVAYLNR